MKNNELVKTQSNGKVHIAYAIVGLPVCGSQRFHGSVNVPVETEVTCKRCAKSREAKMLG